MLRPHSAPLVVNEPDPTVCVARNRKRHGVGDRSGQADRQGDKACREQPQSPAGLVASIPMFHRKGDTSDASPDSSDNGEFEHPTGGLHEAQMGSSSSSSESDSGDHDSGHAQAARDTEDNEDDLAGLQTASQKDAAVQRRKKLGGRQRKPGSADIITREGAQANKLGVAFERVLARASKLGIMEVRKNTASTLFKQMLPV
jgi:hypothetical protein